MTRLPRSYPQEDSLVTRQPGRINMGALQGGFSEMINGLGFQLFTMAGPVHHHLVSSKSQIP